MKIGDFISQCAKGIDDPTLIVVEPMEWFDIINFQVGELAPDVAFSGVLTFTYVDYQTDLSSYDYIEDVKEVCLIGTDGTSLPYDNWIFDRDSKILDLDPKTSKDSDNDPAEYSSFTVTWLGHMTTAVKFDDLITLTQDKLVILKKICIKEALRRVLLDHAKLDRYRTLVGRGDEYKLIAIIRDLTTEIEMAKRKVTNVHSVRTF